MSINVSQNLLYIYALIRLGLANPNFQKRIQVLRSTLKMANFNYFPDVDSLKGHCSSVQFTLYGHNLKRLAHSTEFSESICILWRVYGASCVPLCLKADGIWVGPVGTWGYGPLQILAVIGSKHFPSNDLLFLFALPHFQIFRRHCAPASFGLHCTQCQNLGSSLFSSQIPAVL